MHKYYMMMYKYTTTVLVSVSLAIACTAQAPKFIKQPCRLIFKHVVDSQTMHLNSTYKNSFGEEYTLKTFKYYISNISFLSVQNKMISFKGSHLINEADSSSKTITLQIPKGSFKRISFLIGVDSMHNISGTQTGDLDPAKGMFWTWNTGYIMARLEATSPSSTAQNNNVTFHIGGFKGNQNTARKVVVDFPDILYTNGSNEVIIQANVNRWFDAEHSLKIVSDPVCTTMGKLAAQFADNYGKMFKILSVR